MADKDLPHVDEALAHADEASPEKGDAKPISKWRIRLGRLKPSAVAIPRLQKLVYNAVPLLMFVAAAVYLISPNELPVEDASDNVGQAWGRAISRLGIDPIYPPQEDLFVGDVYLSVRNTQEGNGRNTALTGISSGRSIKIGRVDVREKIPSRPYLFGTDSPQGLGSVEEAQAAPAAKPPKKVELYLTAFPGVTIKQYVEAETSWWQFGLARKSGETEEILITSAETYSVSSIDATTLLLTFCEAKETLFYCQDQIARKLLSYSLGEGINHKENNQYVFQLTVTLIRQVYTARQITTVRYRGDLLTADVAKQRSGNGEASTDQSGGNTDEAKF
jgi:hypothetical protein